MKAMRVIEWGQPLQFEDVPQPQPAADEVLVRVHAASINPFDSFVHAGYMQGFLSLPLTLGTDFAGEVVETGAGVQHLRPGDAVYGLVPMHPGAFAEYVVAKAGELAYKPKTLNFVEAAGVPLASLAGYQSLKDLGQAREGDNVLIIGAAGAVGGCALQLAKRLGATVYAVDIPEKADFVRSLGADRFIDARSERYEDVVGKIDLVLDYVGGENQQRAFRVLPDGGRYVTSLMLDASQEEAERRGIQVAGLATQPRADQLEEIAQLIDSGQLRTFVHRTFPLSEAQAAMEYRQTITQPGKVVLEVA
jgi:NADPH:quinone reductase-like Zn-dependent oxidoreductase